MCPNSKDSTKGFTPFTSQQEQQTQPRSLAYENKAFKDEEKDFFSKFLIEFEQANPVKRGMLDLLKSETDVSDKAVNEIFRGRALLYVENDESFFRDMEQLLRHLYVWSAVFEKDNETVYGTDTNILALIEKLKQEVGLEGVIQNLAIKKYGITLLTIGFARTALIIANEVNFMKEQKALLTQAFKVLVKKAINTRCWDENRTQITQNVCQALKVNDELLREMGRKMSFALHIIFQVNEEDRKEMLLGFETDETKLADKLVEDAIKVSLKALEALEMAYGQKVKEAKAHLIDTFVPIKLMPAIAATPEEAFDRLLGSCVRDDKAFLKIESVEQFKGLLAEKEIKDELDDFNARNKINDKMLSFIAKRAQDFIDRLNKRSRAVMAGVEDNNFAASFLKPAAKEFLQKNFYDIMLAFPELKLEKFQTLNLALGNAFATYVVETIRAEIKGLAGEQKREYSERQMKVFCELCIRETAALQ